MKADPKHNHKISPFWACFFVGNNQAKQEFSEKKKDPLVSTVFNVNHPLVSIGKGRALRIQNGNLALQDQDRRLAANTSDFERTDIDQGCGIEMMQYGYNYGSEGWWE